MSALVLLGWLVFPRLSSAQDDAQPEIDDPAYETEVRAERPRVTPVADTAGFAVEIDAEEAVGRATSVAELIEHSPGVSTRTLGGLGGFATVSVRGSAANQVLILLDGVPLNTATLSQVDLSSVAPDLLERLEVYRSGAPIWLGAAPMGGVVNLVTRQERAPMLAASASVGSFRTRKATLIGATPILQDPSWNVLLGVNYLGSEGDFTFHDDGGTPFNPVDDGDAVRRNNDFDAGHLLFRTSLHPAPNLRLSLQEAADIDRRGIPGLGQNQADQAGFESFRSITQLSGEAVAWPATVIDTRWRLYADVLRNRLTDRAGEIGLGRRDVVASGDAFGGQLRVSLLPATMLDLDWVTEARWETYRARDELADSTPRADARRALLAPSLSVNLSPVDGHLLLTGGARAELVRSRYGDTVPFSYSPQAPEPDRTDALWATQAGFRLSSEPEPVTVSLHGTLGRFARVPTLVEMFGDSGSVVGNGGLRPESVVGGDVGVTTAWAARGWEGTLALAMFSYRYDDLIQFVQNSQRVARPENIASARIDGIEVGWSGLFDGLINWSLAYTLTGAVDTSDVAGQSGRQLPGRPTHVLRAALGASWAGLEAVYSLDVESGNVLDRAGYRVVPERVFHGLRLSYTPERLSQWTLTLEADNLFDARVEEVPVLPQPPGIEVTARQAVSDYLGFPLPGRTVFATLRWEAELEQR